MSMLLSCCCNQIQVSGVTPIMTDVSGATTTRTGTSGTFGVNCDWAITATPIELTITYTTEIDVTTHRNSIGWGFNRGVFGTYRTMRPDYILEPTKLLTLGLRTGVNHQKNIPSFGYGPAGTLRPKTYQVFFNEVAVSDVVSVHQTETWPNNIMPLSFDPPSSYSQLRIDVVTYFDDYPTVDATSRIVIPWDRSTPQPGLVATYNLRHAPFKQPADVIAPPGDVGPFGFFFALENVTSLFNVPRWLPQGSDWLPLQSPWYQRSGGTDSAIPDVLTPTIGLWNGGTANFFNAIEPVVSNDVVPFNDGRPGSGNVREVQTDGPREAV